MRIHHALSVLLSSLFLAGLLVVPSAEAQIYPTDRCVAEKLRAAGQQCRQVLGAWANGNGSLLERRLAASARALDRAWASAEARSASASVDCAQTTVTSDAMADLIAAGAEQIAAGAGGDSLRVAGRLCEVLVRAESRHLLGRGRDRNRTTLERERAGATNGVGPQVEDAVNGLVEEIVLAATVSPQVPGEWTMYTPETEVEYQGRTYRPICSRGTPYVFFARRGTVNKLLINYQGGGGCWSYGTCEAVQSFKQSTGPGDNPANFDTGFADPDNPENPFPDWHSIFVPYCTGDVHWGDATYTHELLHPQTGEVLDSAVIEHKGYVNTRVVEKWAREHFVDPEQVFVTGSSAGAYGAIVSSLPLQEFVYPSTDFAVLGDAGNGVITQDFLENDISKWGIEQNLPEWIPALNQPLTELNAADLWVASAEFYPNNRFATYTAAYDGGNGGQSSFYQIMLNPLNVFVWFNWWEASCQWHEVMRELNADAVSRAPNFRFYVGAGSRHTMFGSNKVYTDTTGGVPTIVSWVDAMIAGNGDWVNADCGDACGVVLDGDPTPDLEDTPFDPPEQPFTLTGEGMRIICE